MLDLGIGRHVFCGMPSGKVQQLQVRVADLQLLSSIGESICQHISPVRKFGSGVPQVIFLHPGYLYLFIGQTGKLHTLVHFQPVAGHRIMDLVEVLPSNSSVHIHNLRPDTRHIIDHLPQRISKHGHRAGTNSHHADLPVWIR